jgi:hypothetical protein
MTPIRIETGVAVGRLRERQRAKLAAQVRTSKNAVLELDNTEETLCVWYWYVSGCIVKDCLTHFFLLGQLTTMGSVLSLLTS